MAACPSGYLLGTLVDPTVLSDERKSDRCGQPAGKPESRMGRRVCRWRGMLLRRHQPAAHDEDRLAIRGLAGRMNRGSQNPQRPYAGSPAGRLENDMVRAAWRHAEVSGTETTHPSFPGRNNAERNSLSGKFRPARMA